MHKYILAAFVSLTLFLAPHVPASTISPDEVPPDIDLSKPTPVVIELPALCAKFGEMGYYYAVNYLVGKISHEDQLKHIDTVVLPKFPSMENLKPGMLKMLEALYKGQEYLDTIVEDEYHDTALNFGRASLKACVYENAEGWTQPTEDTVIVPLQPIEPDKTKGQYSI